MSRSALGLSRRQCGFTDKTSPKPKFGLHAFRHFYASWIIEQGFSPKKCQTLLGHSSVQMTFDTYGHLFPDTEDDQSRIERAALELTG